jgi:hypothetical protein
VILDGLFVKHIGMKHPFSGTPNGFCDANLHREFGLRLQLSEGRFVSNLSFIDIVTGLPNTAVKKSKQESLAA